MVTILQYYLPLLEIQYYVINIVFEIIRGCKSVNKMCVLEDT